MIKEQIVAKRRAAKEEALATKRAAKEEKLRLKEERRLAREERKREREERKQAKAQRRINNSDGSEEDQDVWSRRMSRTGLARTHCGTLERGQDRSPAPSSRPDTPWRAVWPERRVSHGVAPASWE